jgi:tRNA modification GTPase
MDVQTDLTDTIVALATPQGIGAIGVIRISGNKSLSIANSLFPHKNLMQQYSHTLHVGVLRYKKEILDEVVIGLFKNPASYTGEDVVEISCHGSAFIQSKILEAIIAQGAVLAKPGEFTQRAFLNGKLDLAQAEAVADLIAANSKAAQQTALNQLRGGYSKELNDLREQLINFAALIELELDFSEEDVEFANRSQLKKLIQTFQEKIAQLIKSFQLGNVIKNGVAVAIIGQPNAGKSTLLNSLLNEERAIVSNIAGTTRDTIEESLNINGIIFRIIDTAGIRDHSTDTIENLGIERSRQYAEKAGIFHLHDASGNKYEDQKIAKWLKPYATKVIDLYNKADILQEEMGNERTDLLLMQGYISATNTNDISLVKEMLYNKVVEEDITLENTIVTNARHLTALRETQKSLNAVEKGLTQKISGDLMSVDIRRALHYIGEITGRVEVDKDILGTIFGKFCIGK